MPPPPSIILPVVPSVVPPLWNSHTDPLPPGNGVSLVRQDGFMETSAPTLPGLSAEVMQFQTPDVFHHHRLRPILPEPSEPARPEAPKRVSLPPSPLAAEKAMRMMGRAIYKELRDQGYDESGVVQVTTRIVSLILEMITENRKRDGKKEIPEEAEKEEVQLKGDLEWRMRAIFRELKEAGYQHADFPWIARELVAQVVESRTKT